VVVYRNWLGLMKGDLAEEIAKGGRSVRPQAQSRPVDYTGPDGGTLTKCPAVR
jgi:malate synthase